MEFELLISTMSKNIDQVYDLLIDSNVKCDALVVVQGDVEDYREITREGKIIRVFFSKERGLSKSRNLALNNCTAKYGYIMDDDVVLNDGAVDKILQAMESTSTDVGTFFFEYEDGRKSISDHKASFDHGILTAAKVASIEICVRIQSIRDTCIKFDERFGLGTELPSGEEYIFITDCLRNNLKVKYFPIGIGVHPNNTSGQDFFTSSKKILAKREMFKRVFGWKAIVFILAFWLKKSPHVYRTGYYISFTKAMLFGVK